jgi:class 3 adenylate cyclase/tetratricopeptide (TPR) repeat protein
VSGCAACGAPNEAGQRFCGNCGAALGETAPPDEWTPLEERKLATVLFADVVGFTSLAERTDPEIVARMVDAAFRELGAVVTDHGGTVDKYMGDSLMAVFGVPAAHDDDAERAVAAGLAMRKLGGDLVFSIGINSGEVMATPLVRPGDATVIGDTVNVAARLEKAAGPGEVLCGPLTAELVGSSAVFRPRQPLLLKGKRESLEVWEAVAMRPPADDGAAEEPPLLGRSDELAYLEALWQRVGRDGHAQVAVLCGDAGSGKTRLVSELVRLIGQDGTVVRTNYPAYGPMGGARVARDVLRQLGSPDDRGVAARVWSLAGKPDESLKGIDPAGLQKEQLWGFIRLLEEKSLDRPLALLFDDMHRSAETTLDLMSDLSGRIERLPVLIVLAGRSEPGTWLSRFPAATTVRLGPLGYHVAVELAAALVCDKPLAPETADFLVERSGGNPLYLRELVRVARAQGSLIEDGGCYRLGSAAAVPATIQALLASRLDALAPANKLAFQHAAVLGDGATAETLAALSGAPSIGALQALVDNGLLRSAPDGGFDAADPLLREVAYETLPRHLRGELHRKAAGIVAGSEVRARHLERAAHYLPDDEAVAREAADGLAQVASDMVLQSRLPDARRLLERAVALGSRDPDALIGLARLYELTGDDSAATEVLTLVEDNPNDPALAVRRDHTAARVRMFTDPEWALPRLRAVSERWQALGCESDAAWAIANAGVASFNLSRMEEAAAELDRAVTIFERLGDRPGLVGASSFLCLARPTDRRVSGWLAAALEFADDSGDRVRQVSALSPLAWHHYLRSMWGGPGDTSGAERFALRLAELAEELGAVDMAIHGRSLLALTARYGGRIQLAATHIDVLARLLRTENHEQWLGWAASFVVAVAEGASRAAPPFPPAASPDPVSGLSTQLIEAELLLAGRVDEVLDHMPERNPQMEHNAISHTSGVLCSLALLLSGRPEDARPYAQRSLAAANVLDARPTSVAAAALLAEIDGDTAGLPDPPVVASSISEALLLRAHAVLGDESAGENLRRAAATMAAPGLLIGT